MQTRDFETYQKRFQDFEILPKFSETHVSFATPSSAIDNNRWSLPWLELDICNEKESSNVLNKTRLFESCTLFLHVW